MAELADAIAWLEALGYAHGDIRPPNLMLDGSDHLKVIDFDNAAQIGSGYEGCHPPYARVLGDEPAEGTRGGFGSHGPRTETFAIGSVFYYMCRGYEPYEDEWFGEDHGPVVVGLLQEKRFPCLEDDATDAVIWKCWYGEYESVENLKTEVIRLHRDIRSGMAEAMPNEEYEARRQECLRAVESGVLDDTPRGG